MCCSCITAFKVCLQREKPIINKSYFTYRLVAHWHSSFPAILTAARITMEGYDMSREE